MFLCNLVMIRRNDEGGTLWTCSNYGRVADVKIIGVKVRHRVRQRLDEYLYSMNYGRSESGTRGQGKSNAQS